MNVVKLKCKPIKKDWASGNEAKYYAYKEAWARIKQSIKQGYYLEAVTIEESILSDRMASFIIKASVTSLSNGTVFKFHNLIGAWFKLAKTFCCSDDDLLAIDDLHRRIVLWSKHRNDIVHGIVKSKVGHKDDHVTNFLREALAAAIEGESLAKAVSSWCSRQLKRKPVFSKE
jgi:hypothetical protein